MIRFVAAPFLPVFLLVAAFLFGGWWSACALLSVTLLVAGLDRLVQPRDAAPDARTGQRISLALGLAHLGLLPLGVWALETHLEGAEAWATALALGLFFGQVSNSNAHELIHMASRWPRRLGVAVYCTLLFGHHASAHPRVHHVWVATPHDPNSAPRGMGFYRFWARAWVGSFIKGMQAENRLRKGKGGWHPYATYVLGALISLSAGWAIAGLSGLLIWLALASYSTMQLMLSDYVQHYGLQRHKRADGTFEPTGPAHSWNAPHWYSSALMLNAPRHSDHHQHPARAFPDLRLDPATMPMLPRPLPVMAAIALVPPLWHRMMDKRVARLTGESVTDVTTPGVALGNA